MRTSRYVLGKFKGREHVQVGRLHPATSVITGWTGNVAAALYFNLAVQMDQPNLRFLIRLIQLVKLQSTTSVSSPEQDGPISILWSSRGELQAR